MILRFLVLRWLIDVCGKIRQASPDPQPCPYCGTKVYTRDAALRRFARIELPSIILMLSVSKSLNRNSMRYSKDTKIIMNFNDKNLSRMGYANGRGSKRIGIKVFDTCQFDYSPKRKNLLSLK